MQPTRREFLRSGLGGVSLLAAGGTLPAFLARTAFAITPRKDERILVVVQLTGGNDGLNMIVPYADDRYQRARPTLRVRPEQALKLDDMLGLHPEMTGLKQLHDDGRLAVVTNVGYPNPDRSHFRAMDIWHTADPDVRNTDDGWLGRFADRAVTDAVSAPPALHLDGEALPLALKTRRAPVPSIRDIAAIHLPESAREWSDGVAAPRESAAADLLYVQRVAVASCANARRIERVVRESAAETTYPDYGLAQRLKQVAQLIGADFGPRVYYTSLGGFDTHARQVIAHGPLMRELSESIAAFQTDLTQRGLDQRVALMTFSEFGRRVAENAGQGTDHGVAAPLLMVGAGVKAGIYGAPPDLANLIDGDVRHSVDFRTVYAAALENWLGVAHEPILGPGFAPAPLFIG